MTPAPPVSVSEAKTAGFPTDRRSLGTFIRDFRVLVPAVLVYFLLRGLAGLDEARAVDTTVFLIDVEKALHVFWEPDLQSLTLRWHWVEEVAIYVYAYLHFPSLIGAAITLWLVDPRRFRVARNTMYVSMALGLACYFAFPAAPPRLMASYGYDYGFSDSVFGGETSVGYPQFFLFRNDFAAIPSFHFGWIALVSWALWTVSPGAALRAVAVFLTAIMTWASAATANHLFIDMAFGGIVVGVSWLIATHLPGSNGELRSSST